MFQENLAFDSGTCYLLIFGLIDWRGQVKIVACFKCGFKVEAEKIFSRDICPQCSSYLHCCFNCQLWDTRAYHECHEPIAPWIHNKDASNACEYFEPITDRSGLNVTRTDDAKRKLEDLFKKKDSSQ
jgi:hypothetical protein